MLLVSAEQTQGGWLTPDMAGVQGVNQRHFSSENTYIWTEIYIFFLAFFAVLSRSATKRKLGC